MVDSDIIAEFHRQGYVVARGLFTPEEIANYRRHYMELRERGSYPGDFDGVDVTSQDPLKRYPRMIHMHRWDETSRQWLLDERLRVRLTALMGREPYAVQTMIYFKPPGARGQALHQDQYYLRVQPGTSVAAWMALDDSDEENGCMRMVPGTNDLPLLCPVPADTTQSFTDSAVPLADDMQAEPVVMKAGDVLFFNGQIIHGSFPNTSSDRFRRSLIGHYIAGEAEQVHQWYHPVWRMDGVEVELGLSPDGSRCGMWVERDGRAVVEMVGESIRVGVAE